MRQFAVLVHKLFRFFQGYCNKFLLECWSSGMICFVVGNLLYSDISKQCNTFIIKIDRP